MKKLAMIMMSVAVMLMFYTSAVPHHHHHHELACFQQDFDAHEDEGCDDEETACVAHEKYVISHDFSEFDFFPVLITVLHDIVCEPEVMTFFRQDPAASLFNADIVSTSGLRAPPCRFLEA